jgi:D-3-phosphoglycerate dehydrogenase
MKTLVLELMPDLFWEKISQSGWNEHFITEEKFDSKEIGIVIIRTKTIFDKECFQKFPNLKLIIRAGSGFDNIDIIEAQKRNIKICTTPEANAQSAYEHTLSLIFSMIKQHQFAKRSILNKSWKKTIQFSWELSDLRALIVGVGRIGTRVAKTLELLGSAVKGVDPYLTKKEWSKKGIVPVVYEAGLRWCNLITFHCPLTFETKNYFSINTLTQLKNPVWIINTARGGILEEKAVEEGLKTGQILGAGLDVFEKEPCKSRNYFERDNVYISPHTGAFTNKAKQRLVDETLKVWVNYFFNIKLLYEIDYRFYYLE